MVDQDNGHGLPAKLSEQAYIHVAVHGSKWWMVDMSKGRSGCALGGGRRLVQWRDNWAMGTEDWVSEPWE